MFVWGPFPVPVLSFRLQGQSGQLISEEKIILFISVASLFVCCMEKMQNTTLSRFHCDEPAIIPSFVVQIILLPLALSHSLFLSLVFPLDVAANASHYLNPIIPELRGSPWSPRRSIMHSRTRSIDTAGVQEGTRAMMKSFRNYPDFHFGIPSKTLYPLWRQRAAVKNHHVTRMRA